MGPRKKLLITTAKSVNALKPAGAIYEVPDTEVAGLHLRVFPGGRKL